MPHLLPRPMSFSDRMVLVLAFGRLSVLEACTVLGGDVVKVETPCERVCVTTLQQHAASLIPRLSGVHKVAPLTEVVDAGHPTPSVLVETIANHFNEVPTLSLSGYDVAEDAYDDLVRSLLDEFRGKGFRKTRLLRPRGNELRAEDVLSRRSTDVVVFPYRGGYGMGPVSWVPDSLKMRERGTGKPIPRSEISMSPRLASVLLNLAGLSPGKTVLDPFCGSGTILVEALIRSYRCLGLDANAKRVKDARRNLSWAASRLKRPDYDVRVGDARNLSAAMGRTKVDAVVTEPLLLPTLEARPKTSTASALVEGAGDVYADALASMADFLSPGGRIVVVVPMIPTMEGKEVSISLDGRSLGLRLHQPGPVTFEYPVRLSFESTRWVRRAVYVFDSSP